MIAVTTQQGARERLRHVASTLGFPAPTFYARASELPVGAVPDTVLLLDLGCCAREPMLRSRIAGWAAAHPRASLILFVPLLDRDAEMHAMFDLTSLGATQVMTVSDFARIEVWRNIVTRQLLATRQAEIRRDFLERVAGRPIPAEAIVLHLLEQAPMISDVHSAAAAAMRYSGGQADAVRLAVWRELRRAGQLSATRLLLVFQLLWYRRLADLGWRPGTIAAFLGFRSARQLRLTLKRRLGVSMQEIKATTYAEALDWAVASCRAGDVTKRTPAQTNEAFLPVRGRTTFAVSAKQAFCG